MRSRERKLFSVLFHSAGPKPLLTSLRRALGTLSSPPLITFSTPPYSLSSSLSHIPPPQAFCSFCCLLLELEGDGMSMGGRTGSWSQVQLPLASWSGGFGWGEGEKQFCFTCPSLHVLEFSVFSNNGVILIEIIADFCKLFTDHKTAH